MIYRLPSFDRSFKQITSEQQASVLRAIALAEAAYGHPHQHSGIGLRPFGPYLEFRAGIKLRVIALPDHGDIVLVLVGNHDAIRAYIRQNR